MEWLIDLFGIAAGIALLTWSADIFVGGSAALAKRCGMSQLLIGMIIIGFGTSMPEMLVSASAGASGNPSIALGNAYGSNIANIGLILGISALMRPIIVAKSVLKRELPVLIAISFASAAMAFLKFDISRIDAILMLLLFIGFLVNNIIKEKRSGGNGGEGGDEIANDPLWKIVVKIVLGLALLLASSKELVFCSVKIAQLLGVSDLLIGLTIIAVGTSLPELASSIAAVRRHENDLAVGNIVGSNFFNTLTVVGIAAVIKPMDDPASIDIVKAVLRRDFPVMILLTLMLYISVIPLRRGKAVINRFEGALLLLAYVAYTAYLVWSGVPPLEQAK